MGRYPLDVVVVGREWDGWQGLRDYHPALINDTLAVRLVMGGNNSALRGGRRVRTRYATLDPETVTVRPLRTVEFTRVGAQLIDAVADGSVKIAPEAKAALPKAERYRVACPATGCSFLITPDQIDTFEQGSEPEGTIKLSRYQRILLRLHPPMELDEVLHGTLSDDVREVIDQFYRRESGRGPRRRDVDLEYHHEQQIMRVLNASNFFAVTIAPFDEDPAHSVCLECDDETRPKRTAWNTVARFYLGSRSHTLRVTRPYDIDEARSVVRLSADTMYSLGIEETDSVRISYGGRAITARYVHYRRRPVPPAQLHGPRGNRRRGGGNPGKPAHPARGPRHPRVRRSGARCEPPLGQVAQRVRASTSPQHHGARRLGTSVGADLG